MGNDQLSNRILRKPLGIRAFWNPIGWFSDRPYDPSELAINEWRVKDLYLSRGFLDVDKLRQVLEVRRFNRDDILQKVVLFSEQICPARNFNVRVPFQALEAFGQLFDLRNDPGEVDNRWDDPAVVDIKRDLLDRMRDWYAAGAIRTQRWKEAWR